MSENVDPVTPLADALRALTPLPGRLDRDQLLFRAGQASVARRSWAWPTATAALALLCVALGLALYRQPAAGERLVFVPVVEPVQQAAHQPPAPAAARPGPTDSRGSERPDALARTGLVGTDDHPTRVGVGRLPVGTAGGGQPVRVDLRYQIDLPPGTLQRGAMIGGQTF